MMINAAPKSPHAMQNLQNLYETLARIAEVRFPHVKEGGKEKRSSERAFVRAECQAIRVAASNETLKR